MADTEGEFLEKYKKICEDLGLIIEGNEVVGASKKDIENHIEELKRSC